jgi:ubiquinone/menaquinone biosynthesis C-methylase UbiE
MIFAPYADDLATRLADLRDGSVLETAAGTGVVTRAMVSSLPRDVSIVATDLNQSMLDHASSRLASDRVTWRQADAQTLPFPDGMFDVVVCQFGVMFFPDKPRAFRGRARPQAGRALPAQRLGPHRGERVRGCCGKGGRGAVSA